MNIGPRYYPGIKLSPGRYDISVTKSGYFENRQWIRIRDRDVSLRVDLSAQRGAGGVTSLPHFQAPPTPPKQNGKINKIALVIGNKEYEYAALQNTVNDATDMAGLLKTMGFEVIFKLNLTQVDMLKVIKLFGQRLLDTQNVVGLFYFAGHGSRVGGENYLLPTENRNYSPPPAAKKWLDK